MSESYSTTSAASGKPLKPIKPYPDFPLFPHAVGVWAKKIRGRMHYFGPWADPDGALKKYLNEKDDLHPGRKPRPEAGAVTVKDLANAFLNAKQALVDAGEMSPRTWDDYKQVCDIVVSHLGKARAASNVGPDDFEPLRNRTAKRWGPHRLNKLIQCTRSIFKHAYESGTIATPVRFGPGFKRPSKKTIRLNRAAQGPKLFTADDIHQLLGAASVQVKAMILLGINCGFGNSDCAALPLSALDLNARVIDFPRPKTGIGRRCPLWLETVDALREAQERKPTPRDRVDAALVFITKYGYSWGTQPAAITHEIRKLLDSLEINGHRNFYTLRHTFRTIADAAKDQPAADHIMGHESPHISSHYRESIGDERLRAIADHVHKWLFGAPSAKSFQSTTVDHTHKDEPHKALDLMGQPNV